MQLVSKRAIYIARERKNFWSETTIFKWPATKRISHISLFFGIYLVNTGRGVARHAEFSSKMAKNAIPMLEQLSKTLQDDKEQREELIKKIKVILHIHLCWV